MRTTEDGGKKAEAGRTIERLKKVFVVGTDGDLARKMGVAKTTLSSWRQRGVPYSVCVHIAKDKRVRLEWLMSGDGSMIEPIHEGAGLPISKVEAFQRANDIVTEAIRLVGYTPSPDWILVMQELAVSYNVDLAGIMRIVQTLAKEKK